MINDTGPETNDDDAVFRFGRENLPSNVLAKRELKEYYDRFYGKSEFKYYDERTARRFLHTLLKKAQVPPCATILDVGCGTGFYSEQLRIMGFRPFGLDISHVGLQKGRLQYPSLPLTVGDASIMPFKAGSFDAVFISGCSLTNTRDLLSIQDYITGLTEYAKDNGAVVFVGGSNFTGGTAENSEWISHRYEEILQFVNREKVDVGGPYVTNFRLLSKFGNLVLNKSFSSVARRLPGDRRWSLVYYIRKKVNRQIFSRP